MKKRTVGILLGMTLAVTALAGCSSNDATEAANESAEIEKAGNGEDEETVAAQEEAEAAAEEAESEEAGEGEEAEEEEEPALKVGVLLPDENNETWAFDGQELLKDLEEDGYAAELVYAQGDSETQISQMERLIEEEAAAMIIAPVDEYSLSEAVQEASEKGISVFSYDRLIRDTDSVKYYTTFSGRSAGKLIGEQIVKEQELDKVQKGQESRTIEFLMGSLDDVQALFFYNGVMEILQPYLDDGTLVCRSEQTSFEDTGILRWGRERARTKLGDILDEFYQDTKTPDIICTGFDDAACGAVDALEADGLSFTDENWPMITGSGCTEDAVANIVQGSISCSLFMDRSNLAEECVKLVDTCLKGDTPEVNNYEEYDNGVKIIGTYVCDIKLINAGNYKTLIENGFYEAEAIEGETADTSQEDTSEEPAGTPMPEEEDESMEEDGSTEKEELSEDSILSVLGEGGKL